MKQKYFIGIVALIGIILISGCVPKEPITKEENHKKELAKRRKKLEDQKRRLKELEEEGYGEDEEFKELKRLIDEEERKLQNEYK